MQAFTSNYNHRQLSHAHVAAPRGVQPPVRCQKGEGAWFFFGASANLREIKQLFLRSQFFLLPVAYEKLIPQLK